jgi:hypothetical protein
MSTSSLLITYLGQGVAASRPSAPSIGTGVLGVYYATDTHALSLWNGSSYDSYALGGAGTGTVTSITAGTGLAGGTIIAAGTVSLAGIGVGDVLANTGTATAAPTGVTVSALLDASLGATQGDIAYRGASGWVVLSPGTAGQALISGGAAANPAWGTVGANTPTTIISTSTTLTAVAHNNHIVTMNAGAAITLAWSGTGDGFSCLVVNNTTADIAPTLTGFTGTTITNPGTYTHIKAGGMAALVALTPDGGTTTVLRASGDLS